MKLFEILLEYTGPSIAEMRQTYGAWAHGNRKYYPVAHAFGHVDMMEDHPEYFGKSADSEIRYSILFGEGWTRLIFATSKDGAVTVMMEGTKQAIQDVWPVLAKSILKENFSVSARVYEPNDIDLRRGTEHSFNLPTQRRELIQWMNE